MKNRLLYLKPNVVIEPLYFRWYAWSHLVSPATAAMNITGRHLKIMDSYIQAPGIHAAAARNPKLLGGPFMDYKTNRVEEIKQLREETKERGALQLEFAAAVKELDSLLKQYEKGVSLEPLYEKVPDILKGYVELVYDLNNNPSFRFIEALLYKSPLYDEGLQSISMWITENDERPFVLSTPRLEEENVLNLQIPFRHPFIDAISRMKREPSTMEALMEIVDFEISDPQLFESFFTETPPVPYAPYTGDRIRMRYFGHACILVETSNTSILVDPLISYYGYQHEVERFSDIDLPDQIDYVLITHNHQDHILFETLLPLRHKIKHLVIPKTTSGAMQDPCLKLMFKEVGFNNVIEIGNLEEITLGDCTITGIPFIGEHCDLNINTKSCYHVRADGFSVLFCADSCNVEPRLYQHVQQIIGDVDVLFLGMECDGAPLTWLYGPLLTEELSREKDFSRRLAGSDFQRGINLVKALSPAEVYVYAMGLEPWLEFISSIRYDERANPIVASNKLIAECQKMGIVAERLFGEKELLYESVLV
ncbi:MBL fold metallo-hydrolase [Chitinophaga japonensis]|uniref:L-ascorbate metabolism protein UlaG (Beta-lactamase superfamily) n=1 Tax=Chitinophaga japonensis TaxID=104662 RepID=A0A562SN71_CHIJA|nr:MBL fold metallo-hydrolase [Chitinophaga japonensis]TWI82116.1 L-ascorbate metabolism protein UlaG (beta-lactamase superfamily) [Chitinophaga japonensis]